MPSQKDRARAALAALLKTPLAWPAIGELRTVLAEAKYDARPDWTIDLELWDNLDMIVRGLDNVLRALERIRLSAASQDRRPHP